MLSEKRTTRGLRMSALVGEAVDQDSSFWGAEVWGEDESGNESFSEESDRPDEFDSDFNHNDEDLRCPPEEDAIFLDVALFLLLPL